MAQYQTIPLPVPPAPRQSPSAVPHGQSAEPCTSADTAASPTLPEQPLLKLNAARRLVVGKPATRRGRFGAYLNRSRRVLLTLAGVWVIGVFDLGFTLSEWGSQHFIESNPLAAHLLHGPESFVMAFKFGLLGFGTIIMLTIRKHAVAELACWFMLTCQVYVAVRWYVYFNCVLNDTTAPLITSSGG